LTLSVKEAIKFAKLFEDQYMKLGLLDSKNTHCFRSVIHFISKYDLN